MPATQRLELLLDPLERVAIHVERRQVLIAVDVAGEFSGRTPDVPVGSMSIALARPPSA